MNTSSLKNRNTLFIILCIAGILLIYTVDLFKLNYQMTSWKQFGEPPIKVKHIQYFVPKTVDLIGYKETDTGEMFTCAESIVYVETESQETYRCCNSSEKISCFAGNFSSNIPVSDVECTNTLRELFGAPASLAGAKDYQAYGHCSAEGGSNFAVVQIDNNGLILWKSINTLNIEVTSTTLKCFGVPLLLGIAIWTIISTLRPKKTEPVRRF